MNFKGLLILVGIVVIISAAVFTLHMSQSDEVIFSSQQTQSKEQIEPDILSLSSGDNSIRKQDAPSEQTKPTTAKTATFFLASKRCNTEVKKLLKEYPINGDIFRALENLTKQKLLSAEGEKGEFYYAGMFRLFYMPEPVYISDAVNLNSPDFKRSQLDIERTLRDQAVFAESEDFLQSIADRNYHLAENLLEGIVAGAPDGILSDTVTALPLLERALFSAAVAQPKTESDKTLNAIIDVFSAAGYPLHFAELVKLEKTFLLQRRSVLEHLLQRFTINLSTVFDSKREKSTNLVLSALERFDFDRAAFWIDKGVDPFSNYKEVSRLQSGHGLIMLREGKVSDKTIKTLLDSGLFTTSANESFEKGISRRFPNVNAESYYKQHQRVSTLSRSQDQYLQSVLADLTQELVALHTAGKFELTKGCEDEFLASLKRYQKRFRDRKQENSQKEGFKQLYAQASKIYEEYKDGLIDADLALEQLSLIDEYKSKRLVDIIIRQEISKNMPSFLQQFNQTNVSAEEPDRSLAENIDQAIKNNDFETALELSELLPIALQSPVKFGLLSHAMSINSSSEVFSLLLKNMEVPVGLVISRLLSTNEMQLLENIVEGGFDINSVDRLNRRLLTVAINEKHEKGLQTLLRLGVDIEQPEIGLDALDIALKDILEGYQDFIFVQLLLKENKRIEDSHRQLLSDLLIMYPGPTQRVIDKYAIVL